MICFVRIHRSNIRNFLDYSKFLIIFLITLDIVYRISYHCCMHFLYNYIKSIQSMRQLLFFDTAQKMGVDSLDVTRYQMEDGSTIEICSVEEKEVCRMHYNQGNMTFYEKNIQSKDNRRENISSVIEWDV